MLWHGTKNENLMSILLKGLKIKPPNARHSGSMFGEAIYFADKFTKSLAYTSKSEYDYDKNEDSFFIMLCEVALGNVANFSQQWSNSIYRPPESYHSIRKMSSNGPNLAESVITDQLQVWPIGD